MQSINTYDSKYKPGILAKADVHVKGKWVYKQEILNHLS